MRERLHPFVNVEVRTIPMQKVKNATEADLGVVTHPRGSDADRQRYEQKNDPCCDLFGMNSTRTYDGCAVRRPRNRSERSPRSHLTPCNGPVRRILMRIPSIRLMQRYSVRRQKSVIGKLKSALISDKLRGYGRISILLS